MPTLTGKKYELDKSNMPPNTKLLVVIGVTGLQGSSVLKEFQDEPGWRIRGITRNPAKHEHVKSANIELVSADLDDEASLSAAFEGAHAIYGVTDFWQFLKTERTFGIAKKRNKKPNEIAMDLEIEQGKNMIRAAAAQLATLERLVLSTLSDSVKWSKGEIEWNLHFDGKARFTDYLKDQHPELAKRTSYLQMGHYLSNWRMNPSFAPKKQGDGSFIIHHQALPNGKPLPWVNPPNDAGHFVKALIVNQPAGTTMMGFCELLTIEEYCEVWGKVHGVTCGFKHLEYEDMVASGTPDWMALEVNQSGTYVTKYGWDGGDPEVKHPKDLGVDVSRLSKVADCIRQTDWSSVM